MLMTSPDITLNVNLRNPGQFFACCGLLELASRLWPGSEGWFDQNHGGAVFHVATGSGHNDPLGELVRRLCEPDELVALADEDDAYQPDRKPLVVLPFGLRLDWWLDSYRGDGKSELKVWAGQQTPDRNINGLRRAWRDILGRGGSAVRSSELFAQRRPLTGRFGFDPSASWEALDIGFSPDEQNVPVLTSPATEILAAVGLQRCRPLLLEDSRRRFLYRAWRDPIEIALAPAAIAGMARTARAYEFPVKMRNAQYGSFGWAKPWREGR
jgi:hypothetical protein